MDLYLLLRVTAPALLSSLVLLGACLAGAWYINRLHANLARVLSLNVRSLQAAQELEIRVRQLRYHTLLYLMDRVPEVLKAIEADQQNFEKALDVAHETAASVDERTQVQAIESAYHEYRLEQAKLRSSAHIFKSMGDLKKLEDSHPLTRVVQPCQELLVLNRDKMEKVADESRLASQEGSFALFVLGFAGPVGGVVMGYGVARRLRQSIYQLSVRVQNMAHHLDQDVASVHVVADGDLQHLDQQLSHILGRVQEVAERLQQHQREMLRAEQLAAVGQLAASIAHEVRNPLMGIKMLVELALQSRNRKPLSLEDLEVIHHDIAQLEKTVQGFLNLARLPAPQCSVWDLREVVRQAVDLIGARARQQNVSVSVRAPDVPVHTSIDRGQLETVLVNLFINSLDAMPQGGRLEIDVEATPEAGAQVTVADTGTGIPDQVAARLFTPFTTTKPTGTGLGLSISQRILQEHRGHLSGHNRPEGGACFTLILPSPPEKEHADPAGH